MKSNYKKDILENQIVEKFMDKYIYPNLFDNFKRCNETDEQFAGIDVVVSVQSGNHIYIDEKSQIKYKNKNLSTQSLEINFLSRRYENKNVNGWFMDKRLKTDYYVIISFPKTEKDFLTSIDDISEVEIIIVDKHKLKNKIFKSVNPIKIFEIAKNMRSGHLPDVVYENGLKFKLTNRLAEKPINIIYPKHKMPVLNKIFWSKEKGFSIIN